MKDFESHPLIYSSDHQPSWRKWIKLFIYFAVMICIIGFTITDLIYGCFSVNCINNVTEPIHLSLNIWFQFSGIIGCVIIILAIAFGCCWNISPIIHIIINIIPQILMFTWLLCGNIIYWRSYYRNNKCENGMIVYLLIRLYVGFIIIIISIYHEIKLYDQ